MPYGRPESNLNAGDEKRNQRDACNEQQHRELCDRVALDGRMVMARGAATGRQIRVRVGDDTPREIVGMVEQRRFAVVADEQHHQQQFRYFQYLFFHPRREFACRGGSRRNTPKTVILT